MKYEVVMGLEVHCELATNSKLFCGCSAKFGSDANEHVCPACAGMPGLLPVANRQAIELGIAAGIVTNSEITREITFDKKNYFYPDLPTGYQITQWFAPICRNGYIDIETEAGERRIHLKQIHIEEDAGKLVHDPRTGTSLVDYNRAGVPLCEIVSKPDFRTAAEVAAYLEKLRCLLTFAGVSDCRMQEGSMRCDVNVSVREAGSDVLGTRTEIKNMNSIRAILRAIEYESERHIDALETGSEELVQETRRWDDAKGMSFSMRNKEDATDYRYFPNPDIMPITISDEWIEKVRRSLPEPAHEKAKRLSESFGIPEADCKIITGSLSLSRIFDGINAHYENGRNIANRIVSDLLAIAKENGTAADDITLDCEKAARLMKLTDEGRVSLKNARVILGEIFKNGVDPDEYMEENGLGIVSDSSLVKAAAAEAIAENEKSVLQYRDGNKKVIGFFVGKVMQKTGGKADPKEVSRILAEMLEKSCL